MIRPTKEKLTPYPPSLQSNTFSLVWFTVLILEGKTIYGRVALCQPGYKACRHELFWWRCSSIGKARLEKKQASALLTGGKLLINAAILPSLLLVAAYPYIHNQLLMLIFSISKTSCAQILLSDLGRRVNSNIMGTHLNFWDTKYVKISILWSMK